MNDRQRKLFVRVVDSGSFSKAAADDFVTPQSVSQQIRRLEEEVGVKLLERGARGVTPTEAGQLFYKGCKSIEQAEDKLAATCRELGAQAPAVIRIGASARHSMGFLPRFLPEFLRRCPSANVEYADVHHESIAEELRREAYDVTEGTRQTDGDLGFTPLQCIGRSCLVSTRHSLARKALVRPQDLRGQTVYVFDLAWASDLQLKLQDVCPGVQLLEAPSDGRFTPQKLCENGDAVYLIPDHIRNRFEPLVPIPFDIDVRTEFGLVYLESKHAWLADFLAAAVDVMGADDLGRQGKNA